MQSGPQFNIQSRSLQGVWGNAGESTFAHNALSYSFLFNLFKTVDVPDCCLLDLPGKFCDAIVVLRMNTTPVISSHLSGMLGWELSVRVYLRSADFLLTREI